MPKLASGRYSARARIAQNKSQNHSSTDAVVRAGAVLAAATALVSAMAATASAAPAAPVAPAAAPAAKTVAAAAPAVTAPKAAGPVLAKFGTIGVKAVAKPKPKPVVVPVAARTQTAASRTTTTRSTVPATSNAGGSTTDNPAPQAPPPPVSGGVLAIAASLSGIPYVYGGSTPAGFDCSGFTMYIFAKVGISLPRTAAGQQAATTRVSSPQPGDLVFFGYPAYHVGIYAGNGMMYDSPRTGLSSGLRAIWSSSVTYGRP